MRYWLVVMVLFLSSCDTTNEYHNLMYSESKFKVQMKKHKESIFIVWPERVMNMPI